MKKLMKATIEAFRIIGIIILILSIYIFFSQLGFLSEIPLLNSLLPEDMENNVLFWSFVTGVIGAEMYYGFRHIRYIFK